MDIDDPLRVWLMGKYAVIGWMISRPGRAWGARRENDET